MEKQLLKRLTKKRSGLAGYPLLFAVAAAGMPTTLFAEGFLEEVVVTARKREESLQNTPISISAFSGEHLELRGATQIDQLSDFTPNLTFANKPTFSGVTSNAVVYIRGIGQNEFAPGVDPGVGIYVDGVFLGRNAGSVLDLVDIERVEVLRGPQGTLFGRNTIGGAVSITTKKPAETLGGKARVRLGTDSRLNVSGSLDIPLLDTLYSKITLASLRQDGYVKRILDGKELGDDDTRAARFTLRWLPSDNFEANFAAEYSRDDVAGAPIILTNLDLVGPQPPAAPSQVVSNNIGAALMAGMGPDPGYCASAAGANDTNCYNRQWLTASNSRTFGTGPTGGVSDVYAYSLTLDWDLDQYQVKSITAYRELEAEYNADADGSPLQIGHLQDLYEQQQFSQEFQLLGTAFEDKLEWIAGIYYFEEEGFNVNPVNFANISLTSGTDFEAESWAVFLQGTYQITDKLSLTLGYRYTEDEKTFSPDQVITGGLIPVMGVPICLGTDATLVAVTPFDRTPCAVGDRVVPLQDQDIESEEEVPMINLSYQWTESLMAYATYSEGFKSGGFTQRIFPPENSLPSFDPEFVTSYEVGFKWDGLDGRLRTNFAAYFTDYEDMQLLVSDFTRLGPFTTNAGDSEIQGFELEVTWIPADDWMISLTGGLTDAEYTSLLGTVAEGIDTSSDFEHISEWSASLTVLKDIDLGDKGRLTPRLDYSFRSEYGTNNTNINTPQFGLIEPDLDLVNISVRWEHGNEQLSVTLGVDNLTDEEYKIHGDYQTSFGWIGETFDRGRQWHLTAAYEF